MNPMEDWVPGKYPDRRDPPEDSIRTLLARVEAQLSASVVQQQTLEIQIATAEGQQVALAGKIEILTARLDDFDAKMAPVLDFHQQVKGAQWATAAGAKTTAFLLMIIGALGGLIAFAKAHFWAVPK